MRTLTLGTLSLTVALTGACGSEPLEPITLAVRDETPRGSDEDAPGDDDDDDLPDGDLDGDDGDTVLPADPGDPDEDPTDPADPIGDDPADHPPVVCADGSAGASWRDTLTLPGAVVPDATLPPASGAAAATCNGDDVVVTDVESTGMIETELEHVGGRYYFEATVEQYEEGWSQIGVFAPPASIFDLEAYFMDEISSAGTYIDGLSTVSIAVDLDAGAAFIYVDGALRDLRSISLLPGIGAFRAGGVAMVGNSIRFNFGSAPFAFGVPEGYEAWSSGNADAAGNCTSDVAAPAPAAPISVNCGGEDECPGATFASDVESDTELVILGVYDSGSVGGWYWDVDEEGNVTQVETGDAANGSVDVDVTRPGRIALVLSAYEPTDWSLNVGPDTELASVSVYGFHLQSITGVPAGVPFEIHTICTDGDGGNCSGSTGEQFAVAPHAWPFDTGGGDTQGFVSEMEARLCLPLTLFAGSYEARGFTVE